MNGFNIVPKSMQLFYPKVCLIQHIVHKGYLCYSNYENKEDTYLLLFIGHLLLSIDLGVTML